MNNLILQAKIGHPGLSLSSDRSADDAHLPPWYNNVVFGLVKVILSVLSEIVGWLGWTDNGPLIIVLHNNRWLFFSIPGVPTPPISPLPPLAVSWSRALRRELLGASCLAIVVAEISSLGLVGGVYILPDVCGGGGGGGKVVGVVEIDGEKSALYLSNRAPETLPIYPGFSRNYILLNLNVNQCISILSISLPKKHQW